MRRRAAVADDPTRDHALDAIDSARLAKLNGLPSGDAFRQSGPGEPARLHSRGQRTRCMAEGPDDQVGLVVATLPRVAQ